MNDLDLIIEKSAEAILQSGILEQLDEHLTIEKNYRIKKCLKNSKIEVINENKKIMKVKSLIYIDGEKFVLKVILYKKLKIIQILNFIDFCNKYDIDYSAINYNNFVKLIKRVIPIPLDLIKKSLRKK